MEPPRQSPADYQMHTDGMFWETSIKFARAQIARQIQNNPALYRQRQSRVHKPISTGNSPQNMYRKRPGSQQRSNPHYSGVHAPSRRRAITAGASVFPPQQRPITWHAHIVPSAEGSAHHRHSMYESPHCMAPFQASAMQPTMPQAVQPPFEQQRMDWSISYPEQSYLAAEDPHGPVCTDWFTEPSRSPYSASSQLSTMPLSAHMGHTQDELCTTQHYIEMSSPPFPVKLQQPQFDPITSDKHSSTSRNTSNTSGYKAQLEREAREDGLELVGLGLYDRPAKTSPLFDGAASHSRNNTGRGLKLEDAWTPPDEEGESSDDGHGEDEVSVGDEDEDLEQKDDESDLELARHAVPDVYSPGHHLPDIDLSNKSFLFVGEPDVVLGATALANMTTADWTTNPQAWAL